MTLSHVRCALPDNAQGHVSNTLDITWASNDTVQVDTINQFGLGSDYALGSITSSSANTYKNGSFQSSSFTTTSYAYYDGAVQSQSAFTSQGETLYTGHCYSAPVRSAMSDGRSV